MVKITLTPTYLDPTLEAIDAVLYNRQSIRFSNGLGAGELGEECERKLWYKFHNVKKIQHKAKTLKLFEEGHRGEDHQAERLRLVDGVELITLDPKTGEQFKFSTLDNHLTGYLDGKIKGLKQAPKTLHIWEHKQTSEKGFNNLKKAIEKKSQKEALKEWNKKYYYQAILYMYQFKITRHYLTCSIYGGIDTISCRTESNNKLAKEILEKAKRIINAKTPPARISNNPSYYLCKNYKCSYYEICHLDEPVERHCRTCMFSERSPEWKCTQLNKKLSTNDQKVGCNKYSVDLSLSVLEVK